MNGLIALAALVAQSESVPVRLPPVEQCSAQTGFDEFRSLLKEIVASKDERALLALLSEDVEVNFGGDHGPADFAANWKFDAREVSHVWAELNDALRLGCAVSGDALVAPSFVAQFPAELDAFETIIIVPGTQLRGTRSDAAPGLGSFDWNLAQVTNDRDETWVAVRTVDGRQGFVRRDQTIKPLDYRLIFERRDGKWMITAFVAGD